MSNNRNFLNMVNFTFSDDLTEYYHPSGTYRLQDIPVDARIYKEYRTGEEMECEYCGNKYKRIFIEEKRKEHGMMKCYGCGNYL